MLTLAEISISLVRMKPTTLLFTLLACIPLCATALDNAKIEELTGLKGTFN